MQQAVLIAAMAAAYVEAGIVYLQAYEPTDGDPLPDGLSAGAARAAHVTANLAVIALWPVLFVTSKLLALMVRD